MNVILKSGKCYICFQETDAPRACIVHSDMQERIKICSDKCLSKYFHCESKLKEKKASDLFKQIDTQHKSKEIHTIGSQLLNKEEMKLEDIEELEI